MVIRRLVVLFTLLASVFGASTAPTSAAAPSRRAPLPAFGPADAATGYTPLVPARLLDTRPAEELIGEAQSIDLRVTGVGGVPATGVDAVVLNVTGTDSTKNSYVTVWPAGQPRPVASNLNVPAGQTVPNLVVAKVGADGKVSIYNNGGQTHLVVDVQGWFASESGFAALQPARLLDTRTGGTPLGEQGTLDLQVTGVGGVPANGVSAVVLNVTATEPTASSYLTVWPAGEDRPLASNLNVVAGQTVPNLVVAKVGADGKVSIYNNHGSVHVVVDVAGWFTMSSGYTSLTPARVLDTRIDRGGAPVGPGESIELTVVGVGGVPATGAAAVALNVTATEATAASFLTVWPTGQDRPFASNLNVAAGQTVPNAVIAKIGTDGKISIYNNSGSTHVVVDVEGWFGPSFANSPPTVLEGAQVGWRFVPNQILMRPGTTRVVQLVQTGLDGLPTGSALPDGVTFAMTGGPSAVMARSVGGGYVEVTAGAQIDTAIVAAQIPNVALSTTLAVTVATLKPGVVAIDDAAVAFPPPGLPLDGDVDKIVGPEITADGVGPFSWPQIRARIDLPASDFGGVAEGALGGVTARYPLVLRGAAPPVGTLIVGSGGSGLTGRIVETPGASSLTVAGYSLVTVELVGLQEIYQDLHYSLTYQDLLAIGAVPAAMGNGPGSTGEATAAVAANSGPGRTVHSTADNTPPPPPPPATPTPDPGSNATVAAPGNVAQPGAVEPPERCEVTGGAGAFEFSPVFTMDTVPTLNVALDITDGGLNALRVEAGATLTLGFSPKVKIQPTASLQIECLMGRFSGLEVFAPGPLAAFMSLFGTAAQKGRVAVTLAGGPKVEAGLSCSLSIPMIAGFSYEASAGTSDLSNATPTASCKPVWEPSQNVGDGVGYSVEATVGTPLVAPIGLRLGGAVVGAIGRLMSFFTSYGLGLGQVDAVTAEINPQIRITTENDINAVSFKNAKSAFVAEAIGKVSLNVKPLKWILSRFGATDRAFEAVLFQQTLPITQGYAALNSTRMEATIDGETVGQSPAIFVQTDDKLDIVTALAPSTSGVGIVTFPIETAKLYEVQSDTSLVPSDLFPVTVIASTGAEAAYGKTSIEVKTTITKGICDQLRDTPREFAIVGDAPFDFFIKISAPAYGGRFKIQCVDGKVAWDTLSIDELDPNDGTTVHVISSGGKDDVATISSSADWITPSPVEIELTGDPAPGAESKDEVALTPDAETKCVPGRTAVLTVKTKHRGSSELSVTEKNPCYVKWEQDRLIAPAGDDNGGTSDVTANLLTKGREADYTQAVIDESVDWMTVSPADRVQLPDTHGDEETIPFTFTVTHRKRTCEVQLPRSATVTITTGTRGEVTLTVVDPKVEPYEDCGFTFTPKKLSGTGTSTLKLRDDQLADGTADWVIDDVAGLPDWLGVAPQSGTISTASPSPVGFAILPTKFDPCVGRPAATVVITATATIPPTDDAPGEKVLTASISVTRPVIPPDDCPKTHGGARGDPHMTSMDGVNFEGQILGEYIYARSPEGADNPYEIVVRTEPTSGSKLSVAPTSVTALAIVQSDHTVETYRAANGSNDVLVDGVLTPLVDGVPLPVSATMTITQTTPWIRFDLPGITVSMSNTGIYNLDLAAAVGTPMEGLLGSPDGAQGNDFTTPTGVEYSVADIQHNVIPAFFDYVASWRITDPADSPFTRSYAEFGAVNPGFSQQVFDEFAPQVDAAIVGSDRICVGTLTDQQRYGLALELSIGTPIADLDRYICSYSVSGVVTSDGLPAAGLRVTVDGVGVRPCVTTSGTDGRYVCVLLPDLAEVAATSGDIIPMTVDVTGTWPDVATTAAHGTTVFTTRSSFNSGPSINTVDLTVDPNSIPRLDISGVVLLDGSPVAGTTSFRVNAYGANGALIQQTTDDAVVDIVDGHYAFSRVLPPAAVRAVVGLTIAGPLAEAFSQDVTDIVGGRRAVTFDAAYTVPRLTISGALTDTSNPAPPGTVLVVSSKTATGVTLPTQFVTAVPAPSTGAYSVNVVLPRAAATAVVSTTFGASGETFTGPTVPIVAGPNATRFDVAVTPVLLRLTGTMVDETGAALANVPVVVTFYAANGSVLSTRGLSISADPTSHRYDATFVGRSGAVRATITATVGAQFETFTGSATGLVDGTNPVVTFDVATAPVRLTVSGHVVDQDGVGVTNAFRMDAFFFDAADHLVTEIRNANFVTPDNANGHFSTTFTGHRDAVRVLLRAYVGPIGEYVETNLAGLGRGDNAGPFEIQYGVPVVTITGTMTGPGGTRLTSGYVPVEITGTDADGTERFFRTEYVTLGADGSYSITETMSQLATSVTARYKVGIAPSDWFTLAPTAVVKGANTIPYDIAYLPPTVTVSGTLLKSPGVPLGAPYVPVPLGISAYGTGSDGPEFLYYTQPNVTPLADGSYTATFTLPLRTTSVEARLFIAGRNDTVTTLDGFTPNTHRDMTLNAVHNPPSLVVHGSAKIDGVPVTGSQSVIINVKSYAGDTLNTQFTVYSTPVSPGQYSQTMLLPHGSTRAEITVQPRYGSGTYPATPVDLLPGEQRDVPVSFDDPVTKVTVSGNFLALGVPATAAYLSATASDATHSLGNVSIGSVDVDPDTGAYTTTFSVPTGTTRVSVFAGLTSPLWGNTISESHEFGPTIVAGTTTADAWSTDSTLVRITGSLVDGGNRAVVPGDDPDNGTYADLGIAVDLAGPHGFSTAETVTYQADNTFSLELVVPDDSTGINLTMTGVFETDPVLNEPLGGTGGIVDLSWDIDLANLVSTRYVVSGTVTQDAQPMVGAPIRVEVVGFAFVDNDTPYTEVFRRSIDVVTLDQGYYGIGYDLPPTANLVRSTVTVLDANGDPLPGGDHWTVVTHLTVGEFTVATLDIEVGTSSFDMSGGVTLDGCAGPLVFEREVWVFTGPYPTEGYDPDNRTWLGGTRVLATEVVPDVTAAYAHGVRVHIPGDTTWIGTVYRDHNSGGWGMNIESSPYPANAYIGGTFDETAHC